MSKRFLVAGVWGGAVLIVWVFVVDGLLGVERSVEMKRIPNERVVYETLRRNIAEPGGYLCNPELTPDRVYPGDAPVFAIRYSGVGHASAGQEMLIGLLVCLVAPVLGAWLLSKTSAETQASYPQKVLFFVVLGVVVALFGDIGRFGIGGYPMRDALALALRDTASWALVGLVVAWRIRRVVVAEG